MGFMIQRGLQEAKEHSRSGEGAVRNRPSREVVLSVAEPRQPRVLFPRAATEAGSSRLRCSVLES